MLRLLVLTLAAPLAAADSNVPTARTVTLEPGSPATLAKAVEQQTGIAVDVSGLAPATIAVSGKGLEFWTALDRIAVATGSRITTSQGKISLKPGKSHAPTHVQGPFRFSAREVSARADLATGTVAYEVGLDLTWEPGRHVFRTDGTPRITRATDDAGRAVGVSPGGSRVPAAWTTAPLLVRPTGLGRATRTLTLEGSVLVTLADELLTFSFPSAAITGKAAEQKGVSVAIVKAAAEGNDWVVEVALTYPAGGAVFESFEGYWRGHNVMRLLPPNGGEPIVLPLEKGTDGRYVAKGLGKAVGAGWKLDYRTPGPIREVTVPFVLKDIPLP